MSDQQRENLTGHPSDYGSRTLESEEAEQRTADGEPRSSRGTADSAVSHDTHDVKEGQDALKRER